MLFFLDRLSNNFIRTFREDMNIPSFAILAPCYAQLEKASNDQKLKRRRKLSPLLHTLRLWIRPLPWVSIPVPFWDSHGSCPYALCSCSPHISISTWAILQILLTFNSPFLLYDTFKSSTCPMTVICFPSTILLLAIVHKDCRGWLQTHMPQCLQQAFDITALAGNIGDMSRVTRMSPHYGDIAMSLQHFSWWHDSYHVTSHTLYLFIYRVSAKTAIIQYPVNIFNLYLSPMEARTLWWL